MMQFNPLFFNMNQASPEISKPEKFGGVSYLFSDIIKVFLNENEEQNSQGKNVLGSAQGQIDSMLALVNKPGNCITGEKTIEPTVRKKFKMSLEEISDSSVQKIFAGIANAILQGGTEISVKKSSQNSLRKIELDSAVPEDEIIKTISLFIDRINENFGFAKEEKAAFGAEQHYEGGHAQSYGFPDPGQASNEIKGEISSAAGINSIRFKLESPGELLTLELTKPEKELHANISNKSLNVFKNFPEPEQREFKLQLSYSLNSINESLQDSSINLEQVDGDRSLYKEVINREAIYSRDSKIEFSDKSAIRPDKYFQKEAMNLKSNYPEIKQAELTIKPAVQQAGKYTEEKAEVPKAIYTGNSNTVDENKSISPGKLNNNNNTGLPEFASPENLNIEDGKKSIPSVRIFKKDIDLPESVHPESGVRNDKSPLVDKISSPLENSKANIPVYNNLKNEIRLRVAVEPKELLQSDLNTQHTKIQNSFTGIYKPGEDVIDPAPANASKGTVFLSLEISKEKELSADHLSESGFSPAKENEKNKIIIKEESNTLEVHDKRSDGSQSPNSGEFKHDDVSSGSKIKIQDTASLNQGKEFISTLHNEQIQIKETVQKGLPTLPSFTSEETKIIDHANLNEEINGIIKQHEVKSVILKLQPEELGKVKVVLDMMNNGIRANIEVGNEAVRQTVQSNIEQLKVNLIQQGVQLNSLNVTLNNSEQKPNKAFDQKKQRYSESDSREQAGRVENTGSTSKKLGYNTYEYLI